MRMTVGSICSGIEAATVAWKELGFDFKWYAEIAEFPSKLLSYRYKTPNIGDMNLIIDKLEKGDIETVDLLCGGTPCQAFSISGYRKGLEDERGNLALKFVEIADKNDEIRKESSIIFWENVEGVLTDKTNAFGCFISALAGLEEVIEQKKWSKSGLIRGTKRNVAWRVLDAKYFGVAQQRKRLYVLAGGKDFYPENILFEDKDVRLGSYPKGNLVFEKSGHTYEVFREYTDCLYSAYGTKWNGNAAAYNGSLFVVQDNRLRRLTPIECERLMGFPDNYTNIEGAKNTSRYKAIGNSWVVPVVRWIGNRIVKYKRDEMYIDGKGYIDISKLQRLNCTEIPNTSTYQTMREVVDISIDERLYLTEKGKAGILRRAKEKKHKINERLEIYLR